jgi:membrane protein
MASEIDRRGGRPRGSAACSPTDKRIDGAPDAPPTADGADRGRHATTPTDIPAKGWKDVLARTAAEAKADQVSLLAAGVAFFGLLALVPAMVAFVSLYGLLADPTDVTRHVGDLLGAAPGEVQDLVRNQLEAVTADSSSSIGFGLAAGLVVALWSASSGMKHLIDALNSAYDEEEGRGFFKVRGLALLLTIGAIVFVVVAVVVITVVPALLEGSPLGPAAEVAISILRWPLLALAFAAGLAVLYRYAPSRDEAEWRWVSPGAVVATVLWLIASGLFSVYVANFGSYNETYGSLGGVVVAMLWLFITSVVVLLGAELDAEMERQTRVDTTEGRSEPMGHRDAHAADTLGATADEVKAQRQHAKANAND